MADIVPSLFGVTPQMYRQQQQDRADAQALRFAQLDPFQQANFAIGRGANMLGGAIGGALGGQDPELQRITRAQQIASQIDFTDPASIQQGMNALGDDIQSKQQLAQIYRQQQESGALIAQRTAAATRERAPTGDVAIGMRVNEITRALQTPEISDLERIGLEAELSSYTDKAKEPTTNEITNARAFAATKGEPGTPAYAAAFQSKHSELLAKAPPAPNIKTVGVAKGTNQPVYFDQDTNEQFTVAAGPDGQPARKLYVGGVDRTTAKTEVGVKLPEQESEFEKGLGGGQSELVFKNKAAAEDAAEILRTNQVGRDLLKAGAITGTGADFFISLNNALAQVGIDFGYADAAANSQAYAAAMGANVGRLIKQFGAGTGLSDADREYAEKMAGGKIALTETALRRILSINDRAANRVIDMHNRNVKNIKSIVPLTVEKPVFDKPKPSAAAQIPTTAAPRAAAPAAAPAASAPMYARNPQTNERVTSTDGGKTWNPVR
jgi:hypothetical protein